jgi:hypothetical protein
LEVIDAETNFVAICANNLANGIQLNEADRERLNKSAGRIAWIRGSTVTRPRKLGWGDNP